MVVFILYFASETKERVRHPVCLSMLKHTQTHARALACCLRVHPCSNTCKHTLEHLHVAGVLVHAQKNANTHKHTRQRSSLLPLCLSMLKNTQSTCMFVNIQTHANTLQSTCLLPVCFPEWIVRVSMFHPCSFLSP